jgi:hypothetical protein
MPPEAVYQWQIDMGYRNADGSPAEGYSDNGASVSMSEAAPTGDTKALTTMAASTYEDEESAGDDFLPGSFDPFGGGSASGTAPYDISGIGIHEQNARDVAGASIDQRRAGQMANLIGAPTAGEGAAWGGLGNLFSQQGRMATGAGMATDPGILASLNTFNTFEKPMIEDSYSEMGLGRSHMKGDRMSLGLASLMQPAIQDYLGREGRMIDRDTNIAGTGIQSGLQLGQQEVGRKQAGYGALRDIGDVERGIEQERKDAPYDDFMRRAALGESALTGPFGGIVPSTIGTKVTSSGGK